MKNQVNLNNLKPMPGNSLERGAVYVELVLGMIFCALLFAVLIPMIGQIDDAADRDVKGSQALDRAMSPTNVAILAQSNSLDNDELLPEPAEILLELDTLVAAINQTASQPAGAQAIKFESGATSILYTAGQNPSAAIQARINDRAAILGAMKVDNNKRYKAYFVGAHAAGMGDSGPFRVVDATNQPVIAAAMGGGGGGCPDGSDPTSMMTVPGGIAAFAVPPLNPGDRLCVGMCAGEWEMIEVGRGPPGSLPPLCDVLVARWTYCINRLAEFGYANFFKWFIPNSIIPYALAGVCPVAHCCLNALISEHHPVPLYSSAAHPNSDQLCDQECSVSCPACSAGPDCSTVNAGNLAECCDCEGLCANASNCEAYYDSIASCPAPCTMVGPNCKCPCCGGG